MISPLTCSVNSFHICGSLVNFLFQSVSAIASRRTTTPAPPTQKPTVSVLVHLTMQIANDKTMAVILELKTTTIFIMHIDVRGILTQKIINGFKRGKTSDTYLTHVCRLSRSLESLVKIDKSWGFYPMSSLLVIADESHKKLSLLYS